VRDAEQVALGLCEPPDGRDQGGLAQRLDLPGGQCFEVREKRRARQVERASAVTVNVAESSSSKRLHRCYRRNHPGLVLGQRRKNRVERPVLGRIRAAPLPH
jgi:hypothetical protein